MVRSEKLRELANEALTRAKEAQRRMAEAEGESAEAEEKAAADGLNEFNRLMAEADKADAFEAKMAEAEARASTPPARSAARPGDPFAKRGEDGPHVDPKNTRDGKHQFSFVKSIREFAGAGGAEGLTGLERETHQHLTQKRGKPAQGMYVPTDLPFRVGGMEQVQKRDLDTSAGTGAIFNTYGSFIDLLRNRLVVNQLGATILTGMVGNFALPKQTASGTAYWVAEGGAPTESNQTIGQVTLSPNTVAAYTDYTRRFLLQSSVDAEAFVRNDLMAVVARAVDLAAINGSGSSNQPLGILNYGSPVATIAIGTNGGPLTWDHLVAMETEVAADNADFGNLAYAFNAVTRGKLKTTPKIGTTFPTYLWEGGNSINGYPAVVSNQIPRNLTKGTSSGVCSAAIYGNWSDLIVAFWSGMDVLVDPYTASTTGSVRVVVMQDADVDIRRGESFAIVKDITTT